MIQAAAGAAAFYKEDDRVCHPADTAIVTIAAAIAAHTVRLITRVIGVTRVTPTVTPGHLPVRPRVHLLLHHAAVIRVRYRSRGRGGRSHTAGIAVHTGAPRDILLRSMSMTIIPAAGPLRTDVFSKKDIMTKTDSIIPTS